MVKDDLKYTKDHEWVRTEDDEVVVGITDFAQGELGDIVFVELPDVGDQVSAETPFGTVEAVKTVAELFAPITGEVTAVNERLADDAALINNDCYGDGWMIRIKISKPAELDALLSPAEYSEMIAA